MNSAKEAPLELRASILGWIAIIRKLKFPKEVMIKLGEEGEKGSVLVKVPSCK